MFENDIFQIPDPGKYRTKNNRIIIVTGYNINTQKLEGKWKDSNSNLACGLRSFWFTYKCKKINP